MPEGRPVCRIRVSCTFKGMQLYTARNTILFVALGIRRFLFKSKLSCVNGYGYVRGILMQDKLGELKKRLGGISDIQNAVL